MTYKSAAILTAIALSLLSLSASARAQDKGVEASPDKTDKTDKPRSPWNLGADVGVPKLSSGAFRLIGGGSVGYAKETWGIQGGVGFASYATSSQQAFNSTSRTSGALEVWSRPQPTTDRLRYELLGELAYASYATVYIMTGDAASAGSSFSSETSGMMRATGFGGLRYRVSAPLDVFVLGGLGYQGESYSTASEAGADVSMASSARYTARFGGTWAALPDKLVLRLRSELGYYSITRTRLAVDSTTNTTGEPLQRTSFKQFEMNNRLFADLPNYSFAGLTPALFIGLDIMSLSGDAGSASTIVPMGGLGFASAAM